MTLCEAFALLDHVHFAVRAASRVAWLLVKAPADPVGMVLAMLAVMLLYFAGGLRILHCSLDQQRPRVWQRSNVSVCLKAVNSMQNQEHRHLQQRI